jgi:hypothetical protein
VTQIANGSRADAPVTVDEVAAAVAGLPTTRVGTETEYKWLIGTESVFGNTDAVGLAQLCEVVPRPADATADTPFTHTQSSVYFDTGWRLAEQGLTLKVIVNHGVFSKVCWICAKHTVSWVDGCRDSLEISERVAPEDIRRVITERSALPMRYVERHCHPGVELTPYATATQVRHKLPYHTADGALLQLSFDVVTNRLLDGGPTRTDRWVEIETSHSDLKARRALIGWSGAVTGFLGIEPHQVSKPAQAARDAGWRMPAEAAAR